jgi:hypothetical protein
MAPGIQDQIRDALIAADGLYHQLVLLVGRSGTGKTTALTGVAQTLGTEVININLAISSKLLEFTQKQRALKLPGLLGEIAGSAPVPVILDNLEILFDKDLQLDPLRLLQGISRNRPIVASWNGVFSGGKLQYAEPGHPEYRRCDAGDTVIVSLEAANTFSAMTDGKEAEES